MENSEATGGRLILVRHGESEGNATRTFTHSHTVPLTERGRQQAVEAAHRIRESCAPQLVISSPFTRAQQTAGIIAEILSLPLRIEEVWQEQSLGTLAGQSYDLVLKDPTFDPHRAWAWRPPEGESLEDVRARVGPAFDNLAQTAPGGDIVLVSHAGVMQSICAHLLETWVNVPIPKNAEIFLVEYTGGRPGMPLSPDRPLPN